MIGRKEIMTIKKDNYVRIIDHFDQCSIFTNVFDEVFCVSPFIHYFQEEHETNALLCFYKKKSGGKYLYEVVSKSLNKEFDPSMFDLMANKLRKLVI